MSEPNPYESPQIVAAETSAATESGESIMMWFAGSVTIGTILSSLYNVIYVRQWLDGPSIFVYTLFPTAFFVIPAVMLYAISRRIARSRFDFKSTPVSMVTAGAVFAVYIAGIQYLTLRAPSELMVAAVGAVFAVPIGVGVCLLERLFLGSIETDAVALPSSAENRGGSIFWFSGGCLVFGLLFGSAIQQGSGALTILAGGVVTAAILCFLGTITYGGFSACIRRKHSATRVSRLVAAAVFCGLICLADWVMQNRNAPPGTWRLWILVPIVPVTIVADRLVANQIAPTNGQAGS